MTRSGGVRAGGRAVAHDPARVAVVSCPDADAEQFGRLVALVTEFCPAVESVRLGVCAFAARGPARYFGGEETLARELVSAAAGAGFAEVTVAIADGLFAAQLAAAPRGPNPTQAVGARAGTPNPGARAGQLGAPAGAVTVIPAGGTARFLAGQPVSVLDELAPGGTTPPSPPGKPDLAGLLARLGIRTLGDLAALPADAVAGRFGEAGEAAHRLARGELPRPLAATEPPGDLAVTAEFDPPQPLAEPVAFAAKALAERLHAGLAARALTCVRVEVQVTWEDGHQVSRLWRHDGLLTAVQVADRVRWQLDGADTAGGTTPRARPTDNSKIYTTLPDNSKSHAGGVVALRLIPDQLVRDTGRQLALWGEAVVTDKVARAAMRVQALLGHDAVLRPVLSGGRTVRDQLQLFAFGENLTPKLAADRPWPGRIPGPSPALVFETPKAATVTDPDGAQVTVSGRCAVSGRPAVLTVDGEPARTITGWAGPWPLAERWWDAAQATRVARFQLVTDDGRAWLAAVRDGRWQVEAGYW